MTVKEFLTQIAPTLKLHECVTLTSAPTQLTIDIEHNHYFHATGVYLKSELENIAEISLLRPFTNAYYKGPKKMMSVLDDFEVYRWKLTRASEDQYQWVLEIETHQS